jgi:hypothetical protein
VEALAALTLLSFSLALFGAALRLEQRVVDAGRSRERLLAFGAGVDAISDLLTRAMPVVDMDDEQQRKILFNGQPTHVTFVTLSQGTTHVGGLLAASISFNQGGSGMAGGDIRLGAETMRLGDRQQFNRKGSGATSLVANVDAARFRYFGSKLIGQPAKWYDTWSQEVALPQLIMMSVSVRLRRDPQALEFVYRLCDS